jgi:hypothetical protein
MTTTVEAIVNDVAVLLQDISRERWADADHIRWLGEAEQLIATHKPESVAQVLIVALINGVDQVIPADGLMVLRFRRNAVSGAVVQLVDEDTQNRIAPTWPAAPEVADVTTVIYDPKVDPLTFMVSPPNNGNGSLSIVYAKVPDPVTDTTDTISVSDSFAPLIKDYIMYRALHMETERQNLNRAALHLQTFLQGLGLNTAAYKEFDPNKDVEDNG